MIRFLTIARVLYDKGFSELIECAKFFKEKGKDVEFQWLGGIDEDYSQFVSREEVLSCHNKGLINYLGFQSNVNDYIKKCDCVILPSYHEGMSRVLMESLALSKPIITSNISGCKETVMEGINGFLCEPKDSSSLIKAVESFLSLDEQKRSEMGIHSRKYAEERFDINKVIQEYDKIVRFVETSNS